MRKNVTKNSYRPLLIGVITFIVTFFILSSSIWLYNNIAGNGNLPTKYRLTVFVKKYHSDIKNIIFNTIFMQAQKCIAISTPLLYEQCKKEVGKSLGDILHEEELADTNGYTWPNDLFFVKQINNTFLLLGWDGELKDISSQVNKKILANQQSRTSLIFRRNCNYFSISDASYSCELYESISLGNGNTGYVVRMFPDEEESNILFVFFTPIFALNSIQDAIVYREFGWNQLSGIFLLSLTIAIPLFAGYIGYQLTKNGRNNK